MHETNLKMTKETIKEDIQPASPSGYLLPYIDSDHDWPEVFSFSEYLPSTEILPSTNIVLQPRNRTISEDDAEAMRTLKFALKLKAQGKYEKTLKLFQHALAVSPKNPDVLNEYGQFLENTQSDIVTADQLYFQALTINPTHSQSLSNRKRTAHIVEKIDQRLLDKLDEKRQILSGVNELNPALRHAKKEAYIQYIYHSVGIEGNTMTLAETRIIIEKRTAIGGKSIDEHNEILGLDSAIKYIDSHLINNMDYISIKDILEIHKRVLGHVDPIDCGAFRRTQVCVGTHMPPSPDDVPDLMERFEQWLNQDVTLAMHPIKHAALAHHKFVYIHPFSDGNGRTSRLLMNLLLIRNGYPPVIIPKQLRDRYFAYLQLANEGDTRPFIRFIADLSDKLLDLFLWASGEKSHQSPLPSDDYSDTFITLLEK